MTRTARFLLSCAVILGVSVAGCGRSNPTVAPTPTTPTPTPTSTPTTFALSGLLTDGTSGGILPNIDVLIMNGPSQGQSVKTDSTLPATTLSPAFQMGRLMFSSRQ